MDRGPKARRQPAFLSSAGRPRRAGERVVEYTLFGAASMAVVVTAGILFVLAFNSFEFFRGVSVIEFVTGTEWDPDIQGKFGVLPLVGGTLIITMGAAILAVPVGIGTAIYLSEFSSRRVRAIVKPAIELLAGIPSIAIGMFAVLVVGPLVQQLFGAEPFNGLNAIIVLSFMVIPIVTSLAEDAIRAVPQELRAGALALGATRWEVTKQVVVPASLSGIIAAILLGFGRAIGETMAVLLAAGRKPQFGFDVHESMTTMTGFIAQRAQGDVAHLGPSYYSLFAVGLLLFLMTFSINMAARRVLKRYREEY